MSQENDRGDSFTNSSGCTLGTWMGLVVSVNSARRERCRQGARTRVGTHATGTPTACGPFLPSVLGWRTQSRASPQATYSKASRPEECVFQALRWCRSRSPAGTYRRKHPSVEMQELVGVRLGRATSSFNGSGAQLHSCSCALLRFGRMPRHRFLKPESVALFTSSELL